MPAAKPNIEKVNYKRTRNVKYMAIKSNEHYRSSFVIDFYD